MIPDHDKSGPDTDERVSRSYRDVATETAPRRLDSAVLAQAAGAARSRYARSLAWTRPLAWAATIVLCVAIVLELTRAPQPDGIVAPAELRSDSAPAASPAPPEAAGAAVSGEPAASAEDRATPKREASPETALKDIPAAGIAQTPRPATTLDADAFKPRDAEAFRRARETAQRQIGANPEARAQGFVDETTRSCDEKAAAAPETWLECIERLEESGLAAEAERERRLLEAAFPDFDAR